MMRTYIGLVLLILLPVLTSNETFATQNANVGFLVLAQDRGHLGNKETQVLFDKFKEEYNSNLVFVGRNYNGIGSEYSDYIQDALSKFNPEKISEIVILPLFLSSSNNILNKIRTHFPAYNKGKFKIKWASNMSDSYLISQILLDRVNKLSQNQEKEKLVILGMGATDEETENEITKEYEKIANYIKQHKKFKEVSVGIYYDYGVGRKIRKEKNKEVDNLVIRTAAKRGDTLLVPFLIGPKYSHMMSMTHWLNQKFEKFDLKYSHETILSHPNVLLWMKKIANQSIFREDNNKIGVVVMPHGATVPYNQAVEASIQPLKKKYLVEMAYGMGDPLAIQNAVSKLEKKGVKGIIFVRMYAMSNQFKEKTDYILGIDKTLPENYKEIFYTDRVPPQVRTSAIIKTFGGYEEDPLIGGIHLERIKEFSKKPAEETIILLAPGAKEDDLDNAWRKAMQTHLDKIQKESTVPFKKIIALTLREDWPDKRKEALEKIKGEIKLGNRNGRVIVISDRLYGSGPYTQFLKDIEYDINHKGLASHANLTKWLEEGIEREIKKGFSSTRSEETIAQKPNLFRLSQRTAAPVVSANLTPKRETPVVNGPTINALPDIPTKDAGSANKRPASNVLPNDVVLKNVGSVNEK